MKRDQVWFSYGTHSYEQRRRWGFSAHCARGAHFACGGWSGRRRETRQHCACNCHKPKRNP